MDQPQASPCVRRRGVLLGLLGAAVAAVVPWRASLAAIPERALLLTSRELGETVRTSYYVDGRYDRQGLAAVRRIFRDKHDDSQIDIDPELLDTLWVVQRRLAPRTPLQVVCGYRSKVTNRMLRRTRRGVAANSFHMYGKAVDLRIEGCSVRTLQRFAVGLEAGGVGYYPRSNFVHLDTGPVRRW
jgi:uncharacterized protein YcbK (DUF882 family)